MAVSTVASTRFTFFTRLTFFTRFTSSNRVTLGLLAALFSLGAECSEPLEHHTGSEPLQEVAQSNIGSGHGAHVSAGDSKGSGQPSLSLPADYESWSAAAKLDHLWLNGVLPSQFRDQELPVLKSIDVLGLLNSILWTKVRLETDVAPMGYQKPIHPNAVLAKVRFAPVADSPYTGLFQGSDQGLLRLSVTGNPADRGFAPGLAWKLLLDGQPSKNLAALYTLTGQGDNYNFFANELSQYVLPELNKSLAISAIFSAVTSKPTLLLMTDMARFNQDGSAVPAPKAPTQIYFVPNAELRNRFQSEPHDFREALMGIPPGSKLYDVFATEMPIKTSLRPSVSQEHALERRASAVKIGEMTTVSAFIASEFGDSGIFFKHQRYEDR